jgi:hypothetical protein
MVEEEYLDSFGLILLDTIDPVCQTPLSRSKLDVDFENENEFSLDATIEGSISQREKARAQALESILIYDSM